MAQTVASFLAIVDPAGNILIFHLYAFHLYARGLAFATGSSQPFWRPSAPSRCLLAFSLGEKVLGLLGSNHESFKVA